MSDRLKQLNEIIQKTKNDAELAMVSFILDDPLIVKELPQSYNLIKNYLKASVRALISASLLHLERFKKPDIENPETYEANIKYNRLIIFAEIGFSNAIEIWKIIDNDLSVFAEPDFIRLSDFEKAKYLANHCLISYCFYRIDYPHISKCVEEILKAFYIQDVLLAFHEIIDENVNCRTADDFIEKIKFLQLKLKQIGAFYGNSKSIHCRE